MNQPVLLLILGMAAVTYIPRALPAVLIDRIKFGARFARFLELIPYTAMTALIFPGVLTVDAQRWYIGVAGGLAAALLAWRKCPVMVCVLAAIATEFLCFWLLP